MSLAVKSALFIVGPTATGKSEIAADVAQKLDAEIISADAFQIYRGLDLLNAKPGATTLAKAPHHLIGTMSILEEMSAEKFRQLASRTLAEIHSREKTAIVVGGSGLYVKALTHGLTPVPSVDLKLRAQLNQLSLDELGAKLLDLDSQTKIDMKNRRRLVRAIEICLTNGQPASAQRGEWNAVAGIGDPGQPASAMPATSFFVFRERDELYERINRRVEAMFENGVIEEVRATGTMSQTASQMIGLREIRKLLDGRMSIFQCVAAIQQATRRYAKRQLTWFRRQTNFRPLNLSLFSHKEAVTWISQLAKDLAVA